MLRPVVIAMLLNGFGWATAPPKVGDLAPNFYLRAAASNERQLVDTLSFISQTLATDGYVRREYRSPILDDPPMLRSQEQHSTMQPTGHCQVDLTQWFRTRVLYMDSRKTEVTEDPEFRFVWHVDLAQLNPKLRKITPEMFTPSGYTFGFILVLSTMDQAQTIPRIYNGQVRTTDDAVEVFADTEDKQLQLAKALSRAITLCRRNASLRSSSF